MEKPVLLQLALVIPSASGAGIDYVASSFSSVSPPFFLFPFFLEFVLDGELLKIFFGEVWVGFPLLVAKHGFLNMVL